MYQNQHTLNLYNIYQLHFNLKEEKENTHTYKESSPGMQSHRFGAQGSD